MDPIDALRGLGLPTDLDAWVATRQDATAVWRECPRAEWLLQLAAAADARRSLLVHAAADVVSEALAEHSMRAGAPHVALLTTLSWIDGRATSSMAWAAGFSSMDVSRALSAAASPDAGAAEAAALLAFACDDRADATFYRHRGYGPGAAKVASEALSDPSLAAARVRARIPLSTFLEGLHEPLAMPHLPDLPPSEHSDTFYV